MTLSAHVWKKIAKTLFDTVMLIGFAIVVFNAGMQVQDRLNAKGVRDIIHLPAPVKEMDV